MQRLLSSVLPNRKSRKTARKGTYRRNRRVQPYQGPQTRSWTPLFKHVYATLPQQFRVQMPLATQYAHDTGTNLPRLNGFRLPLFYASPQEDTYPSFFKDLMRVYSRARVDVAYAEMSFVHRSQYPLKICTAVLPFESTTFGNMEAQYLDAIIEAPNSKFSIMSSADGGQAVVKHYHVCDISKFAIDWQDKDYELRSDVVDGVVQITDPGALALQTPPWIQVAIQNLDPVLPAVATTVLCTFKYKFNITMSNIRLPRD